MNVQTELHKNNQKKCEFQFDDNDKRQGTWKGWYDNGQPEYETNFQDGIREGSETHWHEDGKLKSEANFKNDKGVGIETYWYENGQMQKRINHDPESFKLEEWYESGKPKKLKENRQARVWYENGVLKTQVLGEGKFRHQKTWSEDGQIIFECINEDTDQESLKYFFKIENTHFIESELPEADRNASHFIESGEPPEIDIFAGKWERQTKG